jgi:hypothetical protein
MSSLIGKTIKKNRKGKSHAPKFPRSNLVDHVDRYYVLKDNRTYEETKKVRKRRNWENGVSAWA